MNQEPSGFYNRLGWLIVFGVLCVGTYTSISIWRHLREMNAKVSALIEEDEMYEMEWTWIDGNGKTRKCRVSDTNWAAFQARVNQMQAAYPPS